MSNGINLIGIPKFQHPWRPLQTSRNSGTWGDRGKGNEILSALEKGLSWIGDKYVNAEDYFEDAFNYLVTAPLAAVTGKTKEVPRVIDLMRELRHNMSLHYAMNPVFDLVSPIKGGWMLKGLMKGSQLEKQLSKAGTININGLLAYLNKASDIEKDVIGRILSTNFAGLKNIDFNSLKQAVSNELIRYNRNYDAQSTVPNMSTEDLKIYGGDKLGLIKKSRISDGAGGLVTTYEQELPVTFRQFTFETPQITKGDNRHYTGSPLGHSRTYTTLNEPDVLHVMESQSDWGQHKLHSEPPAAQGLRLMITKAKNSGNVNAVANLTEKLNLVLAKWNRPDILYQAPYLHKNYLLRQLQENMIFAAEQGLKRMRYPTPDTAAKIEGYKKEHRIEFTPEQEAELKRLDDLTGDIMGLFYQDYPDAINYPDSKLIEELDKYPGYKEAYEALNTLRNSRYDYLDEHKTILKKYADFPKMFNKLFKGLEVRTVTDSKGNTWYEVDIPENFLESEWLFKKGGILGLNKIIGL